MCCAARPESKYSRCHSSILPGIQGKGLRVPLAEALPHVHPRIYRWRVFVTCSQRFSQTDKPPWPPTDIRFEIRQEMTSFLPAPRVEER